MYWFYQVVIETRDLCNTSVVLDSTALAFGD